jgi:hypothetical protein
MAEDKLKNLQFCQYLKSVELRVRILRILQNSNHSSPRVRIFLQLSQDPLRRSPLHDEKDDLVALKFMRFKIARDDYHRGP